MRTLFERTILHIFRAAEKTIDNILIVLFAVTAFFMIYLAVQNNAVINEASTEQYRAYKPSSDNRMSFDELHELNPEVIGWLTIRDTPVDYPVVQGNNNSKYINTSALGEFSLSGALFLDSRSSAAFDDTLSIIYGHNMVGNVMFGDFYLYENREYFDSHLDGTVFFGGEYHKLTVFAFLKADGYDFELYDTGLTDEGFKDWIEKLKERAVNVTDSVPSEGPVLMLSTCSSEETNGRTVLAAVIGEKTEVIVRGPRITKIGAAPLYRVRSTLYPVMIIIGAAAALILLTWLWAAWKKRRETENDDLGNE